MNEVFLPIIPYLSRILVAFVGGICVWCIETNFFKKPGKAIIPFFWRGLLFTCLSTVGGMLLLRPPDIYAAFAAGLTGWYAIAHLVGKQNFGPSNANSTNKALSDEEIKQLEGEQ